jgi:FtsH-binding integral membrane protein
MRWLSRIPLWGWFVFTVLLCYAIYNPTEVSLLHMVVYSDVSLPLKLLTSAAVIALLGLYVAQTYRSFNTFGLACLLAIVGLGLWSLHYYGVSLVRVDWWGQLLIGAVLTLGLQGSRIYRDVTGVTTVSDPDAAIHHHS